MEKLLLSCLAVFVLLLTSCSDNDSSDTNNNNFPLVSTRQKMYEDGEVTKIYVGEYSNGSLIKHNWFTPQNVQTGYTELNYDNNGILKSIIDYSGGTVSFKSTYNYDNQHRMTGILAEFFEYNTTITTVYTYNNDNTITAVISEPQYTQTRTFYLNNDGFVFKQVSDNSTFELTYNGSTPINATSNGNTTTFEYDESHDFSLININLGPGDFKPNVVLRAGNLRDVTQTIGNKYMIAENSDGQVYTYNYTFNEQGLPIKRMDYLNNDLKSEMEFFYN